MKESTFNKRKKRSVSSKTELLQHLSSFIFATRRKESAALWMKFSALVLSVFLYTGCENSSNIPEFDDRTFEIGLKSESSLIQWPHSGTSCMQSLPPEPFEGAGNSIKKSWHQVVKNEGELISAINHVNTYGGTIYIDATFNITTKLPTIIHDNVSILSRKDNVIFDKVSGNKRANELFRIEASAFTMKNVSISGVGHLNPNNPNSWLGKRSAVVVTKNNSHFERVYIRYYTHAAIRLENGHSHKVFNSTLTNQNRSDLGYGVLLRNDARNVLIKRNRFDKNTHSVASTGGRKQSYRAEGNLTTNSRKWHFDVHMGRDNWGGQKVEIINNVSKGTGSLLLVRGPFVDGVYVRDNLHNLSAGKLVELKPDRTFTRNNVTFNAGQFYSPFGLDRLKALEFFKDGEIKNNCVDQN